MTAICLLLTGNGSSFRFPSAVCSSCRQWSHGYTQVCTLFLCGYLWSALHKFKSSESFSGFILKPQLPYAFTLDADDGMGFELRFLHGVLSSMVENSLCPRWLSLSLLPMRLFGLTVTVRLLHLGFDLFPCFEVDFHIPTKFVMYKSVDNISDV